MYVPEIRLAQSRDFPLKNYAQLYEKSLKIPSFHSELFEQFMVSLSGTQYSVHIDFLCKKKSTLNTFAALSLVLNGS